MNDLDISLSSLGWLVFFVILTQTVVTRKEEAKVKKVPPSDWLLGKPVVAFS